MSDKVIRATWNAPNNIQAMTLLRDGNIKDLNLPTNAVMLNQVHGSKVVSLDEVLANPESVIEADGVFTNKVNQVCTIKTADCLPAFICDQRGTQVAVVHCGWRSLASNILANALKPFQSSISECSVWLGPCIGNQDFEVGRDVLDGFKEYGWSEDQIALGFKSKSDDKWLADLCVLARSTLQQLGIKAENIYGGDWCTYSDQERFYSYRRSKDTGRLLNLIWRTD